MYEHTTVMDENQNCENPKSGQIGMQDPELEMKPKVTIEMVPELISKLYGIKVCLFNCLSVFVCRHV